MSRKIIEMHEYRQTILLMRQGKSNRDIAKKGIVSRNKAKEIRKIASTANWLDKLAMPTDAEIKNLLYKKIQTSSQILPFKDQIDKWYNQNISAIVVHRVLKEQYSFSGSYNTIQRYMKTLKLDPEKNATIILKFNPGEYAQVDFGKGPTFYDKELNKNISSWFFVMTLCWSRHQYAEIVRNQKIETWLGCHKRAFEWFGGVIANVTIDNAACAIAKASYTDPEPTKSYANFAEECGFIINPCPPYDPAKKGIVESGVKYIKRNFLPLTVFDSLSDANNQIKNWILHTAGKRTHGTTREKPLVLFETEKSLLQPNPKKFPELYIWKKLLANRHCHIRYSNCQYSFPYKLIGMKLWVKISESCVKIYHEHVLVAMHPRLTKAGEVSTIAEHMPPKAKLFLKHDKDWCIAKAKEIGSYCHKLIFDLLHSKPVDLLRGAQAIIYLKDKYSNKVLDLACKRALEFDTPRYQIIKQILKNDYLIDKAGEVKTPSVYQNNSEFQRIIKSIYH